jgi:uncharacterized membrane protein (DUF2068 family)
MSAPTNRLAPWEDWVLRVIAIYKLIKAVLFFAVGLGVRNLLHTNVSQFLNDYVIEHQIDPENRFLHNLLHWTLLHASDLTDHKIRFLSYLAFFYATIFLLEGVGLYFRKHWAEYMVLISTGSLLPIEFYELYLSLAWWKFAVLLGNLLIVAYLIHRITLDARMKARAARQDSGAPPQDPLSGLHASQQTSAHRAGSTGMAPTKAQ